MKNYIIIILAFLLAASTAYCQSLGRQVLGAAGNTAQPGQMTTYTLGEPAIGTTFQSTLQITVGFQQPEGSGSPFPVELLSLTVKWEGPHGSLSWVTAQEINSDRFVVQRSLDGQVFETLGEVAAAGHSDSPIAYGFLDEGASQAGSPVLYYRLKQVDLDGGFQVSRTVSLTLDGESAFMAEVFPNPASTRVMVRYNFPDESPVVLSLVDAIGKEVWSESLQGGNGLHQIPLASVAKGHYVVQILGERHSRNVRLVVR